MVVFVRCRLQLPRCTAQSLMTIPLSMGIDWALPRNVQPEMLDALGAHDSAAQRSRRDLRRLHRVMGTLGILLRALDRAVIGAPRSILELGAGDGSMLLRVAQQRAKRWPAVSVTLLDRQAVVGDHALQGLRDLGWTSTVLTADVFDWLERPQAAQWDIVIANLFVHHFSPPALERLLSGIAARTRVFVCCEPRRSAVPLLCSHAVGLLGAGAVTREDAVLSVHAGFRGQELSAAWPKGRGWHLHEYSALPFSHCFVASRDSL